MIRASDAYMLSDRANDKSAFASAAHTTRKSGSEENILFPQGAQTGAPGGIVKSVTYTVRVDADVEDKEVSSGQPRPRRNTLDSDD